jgi:hypothetical protein
VARLARSFAGALRETSEKTTSVASAAASLRSSGFVYERPVYESTAAGEFVSVRPSRLGGLHSHCLIAAADALAASGANCKVAIWQTKKDYETGAPAARLFGCHCWIIICRLEISIVLLGAAREGRPRELLRYARCLLASCAGPIHWPELSASLPPPPSKTKRGPQTRYRSDERAAPDGVRTRRGSP